MLSSFGNVILVVFFFWQKWHIFLPPPPPNREQERESSRKYGEINGKTRVLIQAGLITFNQVGLPELPFFYLMI